MSEPLFTVWSRRSVRHGEVTAGVTRPPADVQPLLKYATVPEAPVYRAIVEVFTEAAAGYASRLSPEDVRAALIDHRAAAEEDTDALTLEAVTGRLNQLVVWGNLSRDNDTSRVTSLDSYHRTAFVFDLSPGGEAAAGALAALEDGLRRVGGLQGVALRNIDDLLGELGELLAATPVDGERIFAVGEDLHSRFKSLTGNATLFMQKVNKLLNSPVVDTSEFVLFKADTISYLNDFIADIDTLSERIRRRLDALDRLDPAARRAGLAAGEAASGQLALEDDPGAATWAVLTDAHLAGLAEWFRAGPEARIGASALHGKARDAIVGIARVVERIREASASPSSRSADLLALAAGFSTAASNEEAHLLWHAAFGLSPCRHLGLTVADDGVPASRSWWDEASKVQVSRQLRATGRTDYVRRAMKVTDHGVAKRLLAEQTREAQFLLEGAGATLVGLGSVPISGINDRLGALLSAPALKLLATLLARTTRAPRRGQVRRATSVDGTLLITVTELPIRRVARLHAVTGTWTLPDAVVCVERRDHVVLAERAAADVAFAGAGARAGAGAAADVGAGAGIAEAAARAGRRA